MFKGTEDVGGPNVKCWIQNFGYFYLNFARNDIIGDEEAIILDKCL